MKDIRIRFEKTGRARYISHLDLMRAMTRAVRRAGLPIWYTEGFNKHPYLTFAAPLSLGFEGTDESMDLRLLEELPMEELVRRMNAVLPDGLHATGAGEPVHKAGELAAARYRLTFTGDVSRMADFLAQESIPAEKRTKKGGVKTIDLKPSLTGARWEETGDGALTMEVILPCSSAETINPSLIAAAYNAFVVNGGEPAVSCPVLRTAVLRTALYAADGTLFK